MKTFPKERDFEIHIRQSLEKHEKIFVFPKLVSPFIHGVPDIIGGMKRGDDMALFALELKLKPINWNNPLSPQIKKQAQFMSFLHERNAWTDFVWPDKEKEFWESFNFWLQPTPFWHDLFEHNISFSDLS